MPDTFLKFLTGTFLIEAPVIFSWVIFLCALGVYATDRSYRSDRTYTSYTTDKSHRSYTTYLYAWLIGAMALFRLFISFFETVLQYYVWGKNPFTNMLLTQPLSEKVPNELIPGFVRNILFDNPRGFFLHYAWVHFFLNVFLSFLSAIVFYFILVFLQKYRERFFREGEIFLGTLMALMVGWPNVVLFVPLALILTVIFSVVRSIVWNEQYTTLGWSFLVSGFGMLLFGKFLSNLFHLGVLG